ncbi:glycosyltransferase [Piscinibacter sakaiensis]|uniref:glycosyltransferase n=1 Tax=Piscinibacter sakaiensis TaxID=1547922 RepID=UPI003AAA974D
MIGVVVPAHDEAHLIGDCLASIGRAAAEPALHNEQVLVVVVLDACSDATGDVARSLGATTLGLTSRNVGIARAAGAHHCLAAGARWLAFTDADSQVAPDWLADQLALADAGHDAVCGTVAVADWQDHDEATQRRYHAAYTDADGHRHIHGANLGIAAAAYRRAGGFPPFACSEDVALVEALLAGGASVAWSARPRVTTSARRDFRAAGGFGATLLRLAGVGIERPAAAPIGAC